jgi:hypothetical protein
MTLVRLVYEKWGDGDFLLGSADEYRSLPAPHLKQLIDVLDTLHDRKISVILTPLTLPGARNRQKNGNRRDGRLWQEKRYWQQTRRFWRDLAAAVHHHPAIAALDLLNEPAPELEYGKKSFWTGDYPAWYDTVRGTAGDLNAFHRELVESLREIDAQVPIILESGLYATPWALEVVEPIADPNILYSIHMYEPYEYTTWRKHKGELRFPGSLRIEDGGRQLEMNAAWLDRFFDPVRTWMKRHSLAPERLVIGEFGCGRRCPGAAQYLAELIRIFDRERWHWLFYSFREDTWDGMDYELGATPPPAWYWKSAKENELRHATPSYTPAGGIMRCGAFCRRDYDPIGRADPASPFNSRSSGKCDRIDPHATVDLDFPLDVHLFRAISAAVPRRRGLAAITAGLELHGNRRDCRRCKQSCLRFPSGAASDHGVRSRRAVRAVLGRRAFRAPALNPRGCRRKRLDRR